MAMIYNSIPYFPTQVNIFEEVAMELIEAKYGMKAETAVMKLLCKIYKENGYYIPWNDEQCTLFSNKAGRDITAEEMQGIVDILVEKGFFDKDTFWAHQILTSVEIQKVWLEATKRRKRDFESLPYLLVKVEEENKKGDKAGKSDKGGKKEECMQNPEDCMQDADNSTEKEDNSEQSKEKKNKVEQNKENERKELPPLTPPGENGDVLSRFSSFEFPGYAYNKNTHNLECLLLSLETLQINSPTDIKSILKLSDYGRLGGVIWRIKCNTKWSAVNDKGKYIIAAMLKNRK